MEQLPEYWRTCWKLFDANETKEVKYLSVNRVLSFLFITACNNSDTPSSPPWVRSFEIFGELVQRNGEVTDGVLTNTHETSDEFQSITE